jgi:hypothetical protein
MEQRWRVLYCLHSRAFYVAYAKEMKPWYSALDRHYPGQLHWFVESLTASQLTALP